MATILAPSKTTYVPRRPRNLQVMSEYGEPIKGDDYETEEEYNALFGITEENPQGVGIDEGLHNQIAPLIDEPTLTPSQAPSQGGVGQIGGRVGEEGRRQMVTTPQKASRLKKASILDPNPS